MGATLLAGWLRLAPTLTAAESTDADWRGAAARRIEQHRKATLEVRVRDAKGRPAPNARVSVAQQRHEFGFGALIGTSRWGDKPNAADARRHLQLMAEKFNKAVTIIRPSDPLADVALNWLTERRIAVRGHYLLWGPVQPDRDRSGQPPDAFRLPPSELVKAATDEDKRAIRAAAFAHLERTLALAGPRVAEWDAINHIANDNHVSYATLFGAQIYADVIKRARELAPHAQLWVNEGNVLTAGNRLQKYHDIIAELIALGAKPDGIGFMAHFREGELTPAPEIYRRLDKFAALVPNLQLTELDIDTPDEKRQGEFMREVLTIAFSHPAVSGIVMWQVWGQGAGHKTLWRADWTPKPAAEAWLDLVHKEWWTRSTGATDATGAFITRSFLGDYEIIVHAGAQEKTQRATLKHNGTVAEIIL